MQFTEFKLKKALKEKSFMPFFQPIMDTCSNKIIGCEILSRWLDEDLGIVNASEYIQSIAKHGLIPEMAQCLINEFFKEFNGSKKKIRNDFIFTMNIPPEMFVNETSEQLILDLISKAKRYCITLVLEITEDTNVLLDEAMQIKLGELKSKKIDYAIDDYGAGYAVSVLLASSSPKFIKTDAKILQKKDEKLVRNFFLETSRIAAMIGSKVIAEGVETKKQEDLLRECGITLMQGYRFGPPVPFSLFCYQSNPWINTDQETDIIDFEASWN